MKIYSYLALGDSYTVGEQVKLPMSFPYQAVQQLRKKGIYFHAPEIVAATGFTTDELKAAIDETTLLPAYNIVSLLVGVNNQYRGRSAEEFRVHLRCLLELAIKLAYGLADHVMLLSIPDWGVTPFAIEKDREKIRSEIDLYNFICQAETEYFQTNFIDITTEQRQDGHSTRFLAADGLHPSGDEYTKWALQLSARIQSVLEPK